MMEGCAPEIGVACMSGVTKGTTARFHSRQSPYCSVVAAVLASKVIRRSDDQR